jgi:hypothetical protein
MQSNPRLFPGRDFRCADTPRGPYHDIDIKLARKPTGRVHVQLHVNDNAEKHNANDEFSV